MDGQHTVLAVSEVSEWDTVAECYDKDQDQGQCRDFLRKGTETDREELEMQ